MDSFLIPYDDDPYESAFEQADFLRRRRREMQFESPEFYKRAKFFEFKVNLMTRVEKDGKVTCVVCVF